MSSSLIFPFAHQAIGVDLNPKFVDYCNTLQAPPNLQFRVGDAQDLSQIVGAALRPEDRARPRVCICVGNTMGIIPEPIRSAAWKEMLRCCGQTGLCIVVFWNGRWFGDAVQHFYHPNPQLCGPFDGSAVDFETRTLETPSGYRSHWTTVDEPRSEAERLGVGDSIVDCREIEKGVMLTLRGGSQ